MRSGLFLTTSTLSEQRPAQEIAVSDSFKEQCMTNIEQLQAALRWALDEGANGGLSSDGKLSLSDGGCGCCSRDIDPPEDLRAVILEALRAANQTSDA